MDSVADRTLIATSRPSRGSRARYTSPIPPAPMGATISYGPSRVPGPRDMGCQEDAARIVTDLIERFCDLDAHQSAPRNTVVCAARVPPITSRMLCSHRLKSVEMLSPVTFHLRQRYS